MSADVFFAIGDPNRRRILELLSEREHSVGEFATALRIAQPSVSQHLAVLRDVGLVTSERRGTSSIYTLLPGALAPVTSWINSLTPAG